MARNGVWPKVTFDDVLLEPRYSAGINSRQDIDVSTNLTKNIKIKIPLVSSPMDTVTETDMAILMARMGGAGVVHRYNTIDAQVSMIQKIKRSHSFVILQPFCVEEEMTVADLKKKMDVSGIKSYLVTNSAHELLGIVTERDIRFALSTYTVGDIMTTDVKKITTTNINDVDESTYKSMFHAHRVKKLPIVSPENKIIGLVTAKDMTTIIEWPNISLTKENTLLCGAAVGIQETIDRTEQLVKAGVDFVCVDTAHGDQERVYDIVKKIKLNYPTIDVITGNIATHAGYRRCKQAGADAVRVGVGSGSSCTTRLVSGVGYPQLSSLMDIYTVHNALIESDDIPMISDGGSRHLSGNMTKALMGGAASVMLGSTLSGTDESPGTILIKNNKRVKIFRGMAGYGSNLDRAKDISTFVPEGVESVVEYKGSAKEIIQKLVGGIKSGISYCGGHDIKSARHDAFFIQQTGSSKTESGVHDVSEI